MSYVVNWRGNDGQAGWHPVADLEEAAAHVERLRNVEGVNETKIFALEEVAFEFRPYYRVELATSTAEPGAVSFAASIAPEPAAPATAEPAAPAAPAAPVAVEADLPEPPAWPVADDSGPQVADDAVDVTAEPAADEAGANGARRGLFGR